MSVELFIDQKCYVSSSWHDIEVEDQLLVKVALFVIDLSLYLSIYPSFPFTHMICVESCILMMIYLPSFSHILHESSTKEKQ
jgi:hypothetical protein